MAGGSVIDRYVSALDAALRGPRRARRDMIAEVRDSLIDAADALEESGMPRWRAERMAVEAFGPVTEIAPGYQEELAAGQGRRTAALLFLTVPMITLVWYLIWKVFPEDVGTVTVADKPWWFFPVARTLDIMQMITGVVGGVALIVLRRMGRRPAGRRRPRTVVRALGLLVWCQLPLTVTMSLALMSTGHANGIATYVPGVAASVVSMLLQAWQLHSATHCLAACRAPAAPAGRAVPA